MLVIVFQSFFKIFDGLKFKEVKTSSFKLTDLNFDFSVTFSGL